MFASPGNTLLPKFVSRWPHWEAYLVDALACPLEGIKACYANPPWTLIAKWLHRLRNHPQLTCLLVTPFWVSSSWWPQLLKMLHPGVPQIIIQPFPGMFLNCHGQSMPSPRWPLICSILSGQYYKTKKMSPSAISHHMANLPSLNRYNQAFKKFWAFCTHKKRVFNHKLPKHFGAKSGGFSFAFY